MIPFLVTNKKLNALLVLTFMLFNFSLRLKADEIGPFKDGEYRHEFTRELVNVWEVACGYNSLGLPKQAEKYKIEWIVETYKDGEIVESKTETTYEFVRCL